MSFAEILKLFKEAVIGVANGFKDVNSWLSFYRFVVSLAQLALPFVVIGATFKIVNFFRSRAAIKRYNKMLNEYDEVFGNSEELTSDGKCSEADRKFTKKLLKTIKLLPRSYRTDAITPDNFDKKLTRTEQKLRKLDCRVKLNCMRDTRRSNKRAIRLQRKIERINNRKALNYSSTLANSAPRGKVIELTDGIKINDYRTYISGVDKTLETNFKNQVRREYQTEEANIERESCRINYADGKKMCVASNSPAVYFKGMGLIMKAAALKAQRSYILPESIERTEGKNITTIEINSVDDLNNLIKSRPKELNEGRKIKLLNAGRGKDYKESVQE